jgi:ubiquinone/menaquinone biosynthesis C-methylase UbiE
VESTFPEVRKRKGIKLLEIGAGKGANFPFYPPNTSVTVVDPNQHFKPFLEESVKKYPNVALERCVPSGAEDMKAVPDNSVDVVVSTFAMCHVPDIQKVYKEINRVLVPGGKYFFMEHVSDHKTSVTKIVQSIVGALKNFRIVRILFGEGRPDKDVEREIVKAGFKSVEGERFRLDQNVKRSMFTKHFWMMFLIAPQYCGVATTAKG